MPDSLAPAGFLAQALTEGMSATRSLAAYREAGGSIRTQTWYRLAGEVSAALANRESVGGLDYALSPNFSDFTPWSAGQSGTYMYQVDVLVRNPEFDAVYRVPFSYVTDRIVSPSEAIDQAESLYADAADGYGEVIHGSVLTGLYSMGAT